MRKEIKICLPIYKLIYSMSFILILSFVRGIESVNEIGAVIQAPIALLAVIFCADTYLTEVQNHRGEIFHLYDTKRKSKVIIRRLMLQNIYLFGISLIGYGFFYLQKPIVLNGTPQGLLFFLFALAMIGTLQFWSILSMTICNLWKNMWAGIGTTLLLWIFCSSQFGSQIFGKWNVFSYTFRPIEYISDMGWLCGEMLSVALALMMVALVPVIIKKRG